MNDDEFEARLTACVEEGTAQSVREFLDTIPLDMLQRRKARIEQRLAEVENDLSGAMNKLALLGVLSADRLDREPPPRTDYVHGRGEVSLTGLELLARVGVERASMEALRLAAGDAIDEPAATALASYQDVVASLGHHLSAAAFYLLDPDASYAALDSEPPAQEAFPPLPFPRVWIEMTHLRPFARFVGSDDDPDPVDVLGVAVAEVEQGRVWDVFVPYDRPSAPQEDKLAARSLALRISPGGVVIEDPGLGELSAAAFEPVRRLVVGGVHLITARNAPVEELALPRPQRRRLERAGGPAPRVYFVDIGSAGERDPHQPGGSGRVYTVRWLVRGHWRHTPGGHSFCTCCDPAQIASWVAPYVKGPPDAPWKGRQLRRVHSEAA